VGKIFKRLVSREYLDLSTACKLIAEPKKPEVKKVFQKPKTQKSPGPKPKKPKMADPSQNPSSQGVCKFSLNPNIIETLGLGKNLNEGTKLMLAASLSKSTWASIMSSYNCWKKFSASTQHKDLNQDSLCEFIWWCHASKGLMINTIKTYIVFVHNRKIKR